MKDSDILWGYSEAEERMHAEKMDMAPRIRIDHNYYVNTHLKKMADRKNKDLEAENKLDGYEIGFNGKMGKNYKYDDDKNDEKNDREERRVHKAIGGAAKERKGYPATSFDPMR